MKTNQKQRDAINELKRALGKCAKSGVRLFGMDDTLHATVSHNDSKDFHENYQDNQGGDSEAYEEVAIGGVYIGSGGW